LTVWLQGGIVALVSIVSAVFAFLRPLASLPSTTRRFALFLAFSLVVMLFYNEAMFDRTFASLVSVMMLWIYTGGQEVTEELEDEATQASEELSDLAVTEPYAPSAHH